MKAIIAWIKFHLLHRHPKDFTQECDVCYEGHLEWKGGKLIHGEIIPTNNETVFLCPKCSITGGVV